MTQVGYWAAKKQLNKLSIYNENINYMMNSQIMWLAIMVYKLKLWLTGTVKRAELNKCDICLVSRILWHKRITPSLKEWRIWHFILTDNKNQIKPIKAYIFFRSLSNTKSKRSAHAPLCNGGGRNLEMFLLRKR